MTARRAVIDTGVLTLFFAGDTRVGSFFREIQAKRTIAYVTSVNLSEFYYKTCEKLGEDVARLRYYQCRELLQILETDEKLSLLAGKEKCHRSVNLSLADCFALAATRLLKSTLHTTDSELIKVKDIDVRLYNAN